MVEQGADAPWIKRDYPADVFRGRTFDFRRKFLPDGLSKVDRLPFLSADEKRFYSQVQGRTYANMFALVERFIGAKVVELGPDHVSAYELEFKPGTRLTHRYGSGSVGAENDAMYEQVIELRHPETGKTTQIRRITLKLDQPTRDGDGEIHLLTNLPAAVSAVLPSMRLPTISLLCPAQMPPPSYGVLLAVMTLSWMRGEPRTTPMPRYSSNEGSPSRIDTRTAITEISRTAAPIPSTTVTSPTWTILVDHHRFRRIRRSPLPGSCTEEHVDQWLNP